MVYMFSHVLSCSLMFTRKGYLSVILSALHCKSSRLTELHKLSLKDAGLHVLMYVFLSPQGLHLKRL